MTAPNERLGRELAQLCQSCGLCCDGTLYRRARLTPEEVEPAKKNGLRVIQDKGFEQPCSQLENKSCKIYDARPTACQSFTCRLYARHRDDGGPIEARLRSVRRVRSALQKLEQYGLQRGPNGDVTFSAEGPEAFTAMEVFTEVMHHMEEDFARELVSDGPNNLEK